MLSRNKVYFTKMAFRVPIFVNKLIGYGIGVYVLLVLLYRIIRSPIRFVNAMFFIKRNEAPKCLTDPSLGTHGFIHLEEVRLHYVSCGDESKPLMLCLHGFPEFWYSWRYQIREFSKDYRVVAVDMRGYGDSDKPSGVENYVMEKLAGDIKQLIPALGHNKCVLVSHDWGGAVAWNVATYYPDLVEKLIVFNCPHPGTMQKYVNAHFSQAKKSWYMLFFQCPILPEFSFMSFDYNALEALVKDNPNNKPSPEEVEAYKYTMSKSKGAITGPMNYYRAALSRVFKYTKKVKVPTMVVWGRPDQHLESELATVAAEFVDDLTVKFIEDSSHFVIFDKPKESNVLIREFLES